jgi:hypothetical protein
VTPIDLPDAALLIFLFCIQASFSIWFLFYRKSIALVKMKNIVVKKNDKLSNKMI